MKLENFRLNFSSFDAMLTRNTKKLIVNIVFFFKKNILLDIYLTVYGQCQWLGSLNYLQFLTHFSSILQIRVSPPNGIFYVNKNHKNPNNKRIISKMK